MRTFDRTMPAFDARAARALARRAVGVAEILADMKQAVMDAALRGEFEASVKLAETTPVVAGRSTNTATFLVEHLNEHGLPSWAEAVKHAVEAGYVVMPVWAPLDNGAGCAGILLAWSMAVDEPDRPPLLMAATHAHRVSVSASALQHWIERVFQVIRGAAAKGASSCKVRDSASFDSPLWSARQGALNQAGFRTEVIPTKSGAELLIAW